MSLNIEEAKEIWISMYKCYPAAWVTEVGVAFLAVNINNLNNRREMCLGYIHEASRTPFTTVAKTRMQEAAKKELHTKQYLAK